MRCCIFTTVHSPFDNRIFHKQAKTLVEAGYRVSLIAHYERKEIVDRVEIIPLPRSRNRMFRMMSTITVFRLALKQKADIYHFHDPELICVGLILKLLGKKVIYDVHEDYPRQILVKEWIPALLRRPISIFVGSIEYVVARIFDGIITATDFIAERFPTSKTVIVKNFPSIKHFGELQDYSRNSSKPSIAIYVGGLTRIRGIRQLVEAFSMLRGVELWLVGEFEDSLFEEEIKTLRSSNVRILGFKPLREVINLYKRAHIGIVCLLPTPNYLNAYPTKLFDYMAAGLPVVASHFPFWYEFVDGCGVTVNPEDPKDIAHGINTLLSDPKALQQMGEGGKRKVLEKYNWERESLELLNLYRKVLDMKTNFISG